MSVSFHITGFQRAQAAVLKTQAAARSPAAIKTITASLHRYVVGITHVDTGTLRVSHIMRASRTRGEIYINPSAVNPRSGQKPAVYGPFEEGRGGSHAFYQRTVKEHGGAALAAGGAALRRALP